LAGLTAADVLRVYAAPLGEGYPDQPFTLPVDHEPFPGRVIFYEGQGLPVREYASGVDGVQRGGVTRYVVAEAQAEEVAGLGKDKGVGSRVFVKVYFYRAALALITLLMSWIAGLLNKLLPNSNRNNLPALPTMKAYHLLHSLVTAMSHGSEPVEKSTAMMSAAAGVYVMPFLKLTTHTLLSPEVGIKATIRPLSRTSSRFRGLLSTAETAGRLVPVGTLVSELPKLSRTRFLVLFPNTFTSNPYQVDPL
jgi:hypothetical protein